MFEPSLTHEEEEIRDLKFRNVAKLIFVFRRRWWQHAELQHDFGFVHAFEESIPTWLSDTRGPVLSGWEVGPVAEAMLNLTGTQLRARGMVILGWSISRQASEIEADLVRHDLSDW